MSLSPDKINKLEMLALLPAEDAEHAAFVRQLPQADEETRAYWETVLSENEAMRSAVLSGATADAWSSAASIEQLLQLPDQQRPVIKIKTRSSIPWPAAAAVIMGALGIGGYFARHEFAASQRVEIVSAPVDVVTNLASFALATHTHAPSFDVTSADPAVVTAALQTKIGSSMPFPVLLPAVSADFHLVGGAIITLGSGPAVYTSWESKGHRYSLFQLPPANVGMPAQFTKQEVPSMHALPALASYRVALWPGTPDGVCTWVAIGDRNALHDPFSVATY